jgi:hypothetical protein
MKRLVSALMILTGGAGIAHAADNGIYVGAGFGQSRLRPEHTRVDFSNLNYDDKDQGMKLIAGIRPLDIIGAEINYVDLGKTNGFDNIAGGSAQVRSDAKLVDAFAVGYLPLPFVDLFGKVGVARSRAKYRQEGVQNLKLDSTDFAWGAGVQVRFGSLGARLEYEKFNLPATNKASLVSLGVTWTFL